MYKYSVTNEQGAGQCTGYEFSSINSAAADARDHWGSGWKVRIIKYGQEYEVVKEFTIR